MVMSDLWSGTAKYFPKDIQGKKLWKKIRKCAFLSLFSSIALKMNVDLTWMCNATETCFNKFYWTTVREDSDYVWLAQSCCKNPRKGSVLNTLTSKAYSDDTHKINQGLNPITTTRSSGLQYNMVQKKYNCCKITKLNCKDLKIKKTNKQTIFFRTGNAAERHSKRLACYGYGLNP